MNAPFVSDERDREQNEHHDQDDALFVFREFENSKEAFHLIVQQRCYLLSSGASPFVH